MSGLTRMISILIVFSICLSPSTEASWWNPFTWFRQGGAKRADTLIVTGNFVKSRMLAELIQRETEQPILLLPSGKEITTMFFLTPTEETLEVKKEDYLRFIDFLQPKRVLFLGNESYSPPEYLELLKDHIPVWSISNNDWETIAYSVGEYLKLKHLELDYLVLLNQLDEQGRLKPVASTDVFGGYRTKRKYWVPSESAYPNP